MVGYAGGVGAVAGGVGDVVAGGGWGCVVVLASVGLSIRRSACTLESFILCASDGDPTKPCHINILLQGFDHMHHKCLVVIAFLLLVAVQHNSHKLWRSRRSDRGRALSSQLFCRCNSRHRHSKGPPCPSGRPTTRPAFPHHCPASFGTFLPFAMLTR